MTTKKQEAERQAAIADLRKTLKRGTTVYTKLKHVSGSGMYRVLDVFIIKKNEPLRLTWQVAIALGDRYDRKHDGLGTTGCGQDMGFALIHNLSYALHGFPKRGAPEPKSDSHRPGYTLTHRWL